MFVAILRPPLSLGWFLAPCPSGHWPLSSAAELLCRAPVWVWQVLVVTGLGLCVSVELRGSYVGPSRCGLQEAPDGVCSSVVTDDPCQER